MRFKSIEAISARRMTVRGECDDAADVNRDGRVTSLDALMIMQVAAGGRRQVFVRGGFEGW